MDYLKCDIALLEVLIQFNELKSYTKFLEDHLDWPRRVDIQAAEKIVDPMEKYQYIESIEHKYSTVLRARFAYTYVTLFCSYLEWALEKILNHKKVPYKIKKGKGKIDQLIYCVEYDLKQQVENRADIISLVKIRNKIVHDNGQVSGRFLTEGSLAKVIEVYDESFIFIDNDELFKVFDQSKTWIVRLCTVKE